MNELDRLRADVLDAFPDVLTEVERDLADTRRRLVSESRERLAAGRYFVVVCGEFRRGKSSLLNALVDRPGLFPVDVAVTTCAVSTLQWGEEERGVIYFIDDVDNPGETLKPKEIPLSAAAEYVTEQGNPENAKNVARIEMSAPIPQLRTGLVLVDTPGVGSINAAHTAATRAFLPNADAILFVAMATEPLGLVELEFLTQALEQCPIVVTAITMIDRVVDATPTITEARKRIGEVSGANPDDLVLVGVSSLRKRKAARTQDAELLAASGFPELEHELWHGLATTCGKAQINRALDALDAALADAAAPVANELTALKDDAELKKVDAELREAQDKTRELRSRGSRWRQDLREQLEVAVRPLRDRMSRDFDEVNENFRRALETERAVSDPNSLVREVSEGLVDAVNRANQGLARQAEDIANRFSRETATQITASNVSSEFLPAVRDVEIVRSGGGSSGWSQFRSVWGGGMAGGGAGATAGFLVGWVVPVIGPLVGAAIGGLIGQIAGWFGGRREAERKRQVQARKDHISHLRTEVRGMIDSSRRQAERDFGNQVTDCGRAMTRTLDDQIDAAAESQQESVRRLTELRKRTVQQRAERTKELTERAIRYTALRHRLIDLRARTESLGSGEETGRSDGE